MVNKERYHVMSTKDILEKINSENPSRNISPRDNAMMAWENLEERINQNVSDSCWKQPSPLSNVHFINTTKILQHKFLLFNLLLFLFLSFFSQMTISETMRFLCIFLLLHLSFVWIFQSYNLNILELL